MDLNIAQSCPSCGATLTVHEDDRLIRCSYCDSNNYRIGNSSARYLLPQLGRQQIEPRDLLYIPYLRFRGAIFYVRGLEVEHKIVDTSCLGIHAKGLNPSLGMRPQAIPLQPVVSAVEGNFVRQSIATKEAFIQAAKIPDLFRKESKSTVYHRAFIGETVSCIYLPCYRQDDRLVDGVDDRDLGDFAYFANQLKQSSKAKLSWEPAFINTECPSCGGTLEGESDSIVLQCNNCEKLWQEKNTVFVPVQSEVIGDDESGVQHLPFWKLRIKSEKGELNNYRDFLKFTNQPIFIKGTDAASDLILYIPAFKLRPKSFLQVATQVSLSQFRLEKGRERRAKRQHPVTLPWTEAFQGVKSIIAACTVAREKRLPLLSKMKIHLIDQALTYLPFDSQGHDMIEKSTRAVIQTAAMRYGRFL